MKKKLAINGASPVRKDFFPAYKTIGREEKQAVLKTLDSGSLSKFLGTWGEQFNGGFEVQNLEAEWSKYFNVKHAIAVNSNTSGLFCAVGAAGIEPGDEVIVTAYSMSASAVAPIVYGGIPVFADIEEDFFCLDVNDIRNKITSKTKAIIVVDLFGQAYDVDNINQLAKEHNLIVIEDVAQAPGGKFKKQFTGTLGDIGVFSLNYHKHIHCGEGGVIVTDDDELAHRCRMIRNHAETIVDKAAYSNIANMIGFNYRMTEIEASIAREQLKKLEKLNKKRIENVNYLEENIGNIPCLSLPKVRSFTSHVYYVHVLLFDSLVARIPRNSYVEALKAELKPFKNREEEGVKIGSGYTPPLYLQSIYQKKIAFGSNGYPFNLGNYDYSKVKCLVTEKMHYEKLIAHELFLPSMMKNDLDDVIIAFHKVWENRFEI